MQFSFVICMSISSRIAYRHRLKDPISPNTKLEGKQMWSFLIAKMPIIPHDQVIKCYISSLSSKINLERCTILARGVLASSGFDLGADERSYFK